MAIITSGSPMGKGTPIEKQNLQFQISILFQMNHRLKLSILFLLCGIIYAAVSVGTIQPTYIYLSEFSVQYIINTNPQKHFDAELQKFTCTFNPEYISFLNCSLKTTSIGKKAKLSAFIIDGSWGPVVSINQYTVRPIKVFIASIQSNLSLRLK